MDKPVFALARFKKPDPARLIRSFGNEANRHARLA